MFHGSSIEVFIVLLSIQFVLWSILEVSIKLLFNLFMFVVSKSFWCCHEITITILQTMEINKSSKRENEMHGPK